MKRTGWDDQIKGIFKRTNSRTSWRQMTRMKWDDQMRGIQTIDQIHIHPGDGRRGRDTVLFYSIRQSHITGPQKSTKCHDGHGHFGEVTKSFLDSKKKN